MFFGYFNKLLKCKTIYLDQYKRFLNEFHKVNCQILTDYFGLSPEKASTYVDKRKLGNKDSELLMDTIKYCKDLGYTDSQILDTPKLLKAHPLVLEQYYLSMEEGGFTKIKPYALARARSHMFKSIKYLKSKGFIENKTNVFDCFVSYIKPIPTKFPVLDWTEDDQWSLVHHKILWNFLKIRLRTNDDELFKLFRIHRPLKYKSLRIVQENIQIAEDIGYDSNRILKCGYLLHNYPKYTKAVLKDLRNIAGSDMKRAMRHYPKLIMVSPRSILKIYGTLKEFDISDEAIRRQMNIFHMSPETVRLRLEEINKIPELRILFQHPRLLKIVVHHNRAKSRLTFLQELQLKCATMIILGADHDEFDEHIREGKDINKSKDVLIFLKNLFNTDIKKYEKKWKKHPFHLQVPYLEMERTFNYLKSQKFKVSDILRAIHIILYPVEKIEKALIDIKHDPNFADRHISNVQRLNLVLYYLEKEHHFTGNGIWNKSDATETPSNVLE